MNKFIFYRDPSQGKSHIICRLRVLAAEKGLNIAEVSRRTGIPPATLSGFVNNDKIRVDTGVVDKLYKTFGWTVGDLFRNKED